MDVLIKAEGLTKSFVSRSGSTRLIDRVTRIWNRSEPEVLWALKGVSFEVKAGEMLGVVGANGAGKSTLLRLLGGIGSPTAGSLRVEGRIGALLELGGGFQGDLTGRENAILAAVVAGLLKSEAMERLPEIVRFAELEDFIDAPVRTYSTGMTMRLAFAVAVHTDPQVMLVDEFLSVGDLAFQAKCSGRIAALREAGCAVLLVSHGMDQVRELCDRAIWLRHGEVVACDTASVVAGLYEQEMRDETLRRTPERPAETSRSGTELKAKVNRFGSQEVEVDEVVFRPGSRLKAGDPLAVEIRYHADAPVRDPVFVVSISKPDGTVCLDTNSEIGRVSVGEILGGGMIQFAIDRLDLAAGSYFVDIGVFDATWSHAYDYHWHVYPVVVDGKNGGKGFLAPPCRWIAGEREKQDAG